MKQIKQPRQMSVLEKLVETDREYDVKPRFNMSVKGLIDPQSFTIWYNPYKITDEQDFHITLLHEWYHDIYPEQSEEQIEVRAIASYERDIKDYLVAMYPYKEWCQAFVESRKRKQ